jgi:NAD(P)-dependent dehydrogenase (short-subunit alcohol dehydrogenase family)
MKTVLITGCSSGYGLETARHFHEQGWNVIATMRTPREDLLPRSARLRVMALDVTKPDSIAATIAACGAIDVLVNNAGIGVVGVFEATPMSTVRDVFETNTFGVMAMTQAVLPQFRIRRSGVVVNVTSSVTLAPMPLAAAYTASKMAIEGFTGSLAHELAAFNVRAKLVEPGYAPTTRFTANGGSRMNGLFPEAYAGFANPILEAFAHVTTVTKESDVADAVYRAAHDSSEQLRFPAGPDAVALAGAAHENTRVVRRYFEELDRRRATPQDLCADGFTFHVAGFPAMDLHATATFGATFFDAMPDLTHPIDELIAEGNKVAFRCRYQGTHTGADFMGVQASGKRISIAGVGVMRIAGGRIAEFWVSPDRMTLMEQIGAFSATPSAV